LDWKAIEKLSKNNTFHVAGRGFCGLAVAYFLKKKYPTQQVILFDPNPLHSCASSAASGILEPIGGRLVVRSLYADIALQETKILLDAVSEHLQQKVYEANGVLHHPIHPEQAALFEKKAQEFPHYYGLNEQKALIVKEGMNVFSQLYLEGLFSLVLSMGVEFKNEKIDIRPSDVNIVLAVGAAINEFSPNPLRLTRGQALTVERGAQSFTIPVVHKGYIALDPNPSIYHVGSTYERDLLDLPADPARAKKELFARNKEIFEELDRLKVIEVRSGIRVYDVQDPKIPRIVRLAPNVVALTGMGSKGLLYHALFAKKIADAF
jgi:glycine/D-amino acid oxidase-like deaminating enzyme